MNSPAEGISEQIKITLIDPRGLEHKLVSKRDWYDFLKFNSKWIYINWHVEGYMLPSYKRTSVRFLKDVLNGTKALLKAANVMSFNVPNYQELSVSNVFR